MGTIGEIMQWTLTASSIMGFVFLVRWILGRWLNKTYQCMLWGVVLLRLLIPNMPSSSLSLLNLLDREQEIKITSEHRLEKEISRSIEAVNNGIEEEEIIASDISMQGNEVETISNHVMQAQQVTLSIEQILYGIWILGVIGLGGYFLYGYFRVKHKIACFETIEDQEILSLFQRCKEKVCKNGIDMPIRLAKWETSMIFGIIAPTITLPEKCTKEELEVILLHELTHYRYKDHWIGYIQLIVLCLHWFNPLVWVAIKQMKEDMEYACDERVIRLGISKKGYAETLLKMLMPVKTDIAFIQGMGDSAKHAKKRIQNIAVLKKQRLLGSALSILLVVILSVGCLTDADSGVSNNESVSSSSTSTQNDSNKRPQVNRDSEWAGVQNIAILGLDRDKIRVDTIMVVNMDCNQGSFNVISIPRDTKFTIDDAKREDPDYSKLKDIQNVKYCELLAYGGEEARPKIIIKELESLLNLEIGYYILVDLEEAEKVVDALGGIEVQVPQDMKYDDYEQNLHIDLKEGMQHLDGAQTMELIRFRRYPEGDLMRVQTTQLAVKAILEQALKLSDLQSFESVVKSIRDTVDTNISFLDLGRYYQILKKVNLEQATFRTLPGEAAYEYGRSYFIVDEEARLEFVSSLK
ncbi:MAG: hypothetical protein E7231_17885 [Cellulosilyticum sp.]|nr:hypothetical protein [Cellulosilyticum sp.]